MTSQVQCAPARAAQRAPRPPPAAAPDACVISLARAPTPRARSPARAERGGGGADE
eukprot:CAMPEP_0119410976 /NCGR_PEP_ID=MMETSP1335-20130426/3852_1 /TAXON_ID=259385 /ORGANISM="Chrysoculter rhomboideus, Strain RCC1486" /LENGTH=55 /DNA_ID=CAMNT_0007435579 /DNA_START=14 /DNA_END=179 /DNA_ORIENTATION=-